MNIDDKKIEEICVNVLGDIVKVKAEKKGIMVSRHLIMKKMRGMLWLESLVGNVKD